MKHIKTAFKKYFGVLLLIFAFGMLVLQTNHSFVFATDTELDFPEIPSLPTLGDIPTPPITINPCDCQDNTPTPTNTPVPTETPTPTPTEEIPSPTPEERVTPTETPSPTPTPTPGNTGGGDSGNGGGGGGSSNPGVGGIQESFGGTSTDVLPRTGDSDGIAENLPTNNQLVNDSYVYIPKINLNKPLFYGQKIGGEMLVGSGEILLSGDENNTVLYAHNTTHEFGNLHQLTVGDGILYTSNENPRTYVVKSVRKVLSIDTSVLHANNNRVITLITCDLTNSNLRVVIVAERP